MGRRAFSAATPSVERIRRRSTTGACAFCRQASSESSTRLTTFDDKPACARSHGAARHRRRGRPRHPLEEDGGRGGDRDTRAGGKSERGRLDGGAGRQLGCHAHACVRACVRACCAVCARVSSECVCVCERERQRGAERFPTVPRTPPRRRSRASAPPTPAPATAPPATPPRARPAPPPCTMQAISPSCCRRHRRPLPRRAGGPQGRRGRRRRGT